MLRCISALASIGAMLSVACQADQPALVESDANRPPVATLGVTSGALEGTAVLLSARASSDVDADSLSYTWDLGDGAKASGASVAHTYIEDGSYRATVIVADPAGAADTASATVSVANAPPRITTLTLPVSPAEIGTPTVITIVLADPGVTDALNARIEWGDGTTSDLNGATATHVYGSVGQYVITVTARDDEGAETRLVAPQPIVVDNPNAAGDAGYEVIDLGTLGGSSAMPRGLNDPGQVVGQSATADGRRHAFLWENGAMRDLTPDLDHSAAHIITNSGVIGGVDHSDPNYDFILVWNNGVRSDLGAVRGCCYSRPVALSEDGDVLAVGGDQNDYSFLWQSGVKRPLGGLTPYLGAKSFDMNSRGEIVGASPVDKYAEYPIYHPFVWQDDVMQDLGLLGDYPCPETPESQCGEAIAVDINNHGQVVGFSTTTLNRLRGVLWSGGGITELGFDRAVAINDAGDVIGVAGDQSFFWRAGTATSLGSLGGGSTVVVGMNEQSMVVGFSRTAWGAVHVFVWRPGDTQLTDLGTGPGELQATVAGAVAINARGDIIGFAGACDVPTLLSARTCSGDGSGGPIRAILWRRK